MRPRNLPDPFEFALPCLAALVLCLPVLHLGYFWDDYYFLTGAQTDPTHYIRPIEGATFFRPISQGVYFLFLLQLGRTGSAIGHVLNLGLLVAAVLLLALLVSRLAGRRAGVMAGFAFAALAPMPTLVAWVSGAQDLLAIVFFLAALLALEFRLRIPAAALALAALLSKETILMAYPLAAGWDWIRGREPRRWGSNLLLLGIPALVWLGIHPGIRSLFRHGFHSGATGYVGFENPGRWVYYAGGYLLTLINVPVTGPATPWPWDRTVVGAVCLALVLTWLWFRPRSEARATVAARDGGPIPFHRLAGIGALLAVPPILLTSILVRRWNPYFAAIPALGTSMIVGALAAAAPARVAAVAAALFIAGGVWCRGIQEPGGIAYTERDCIAADRAARHLDAAFHALHPTLPPGSRLLVSAAQSGTLGVHGTLIDNQAARIWYGDRALRTELPERRDGGRPELLFRVTPDLDLIEIDPDAPALRTVSGRPPDPDQAGRTIRSYARGLAATGETARAVAILERLAGRDQGLLRDYDLRLAAMLWLSAGRQEEAVSLMSRAASLPRGFAIDMLAKIYAEPAGKGFDPALADTAGFTAFGLSVSDAGVLRDVARAFANSGYAEQAAAFARRLDRITPGDPVAASILRGR